jgi:hypothetical protein
MTKHRVHWSEEDATAIVDAIREYTDSSRHGGGWNFDMDRDAAINFVSAILIATSMRKPPS